MAKCLFHREDKSIAKCILWYDEDQLTHKTELLSKKAISRLPPGVTGDDGVGATYYVREILKSIPIGPLDCIDSSADEFLVTTIFEETIDFFRYLVSNGLKIPGACKEAVKLYCGSMAFITGIYDVVFMQVWKLEACKKNGDQILLLPLIFKRLLLQKKEPKDISISCGPDCRIKSCAYYLPRYSNEKIHYFCTTSTSRSILEALKQIVPRKTQVLDEIQNVISEAYNFPQ